MSAGGPRLRVARWKVTCVGTVSGTNAGWAADGLQGFTGLPAQIPTNYVHEVKADDGTVLATATFGETTEPRVSKIAWPHGFIFSAASPGR